MCGCVWCDVKESWSTEKYPTKPVDEIVKKAMAFPTRKVVITGGEQLMHELGELTRKLKLQDFNIHIETSGVYPLSGLLDWVCFSPKKFKKPLPQIYHRADELKIIVYNASDFSWAEAFCPENATQLPFTFATGMGYAAKDATPNH